MDGAMYIYYKRKEKTPHVYLPFHLLCCFSISQARARTTPSKRGRVPGCRHRRCGGFKEGKKEKKRLTYPCVLDLSFSTACSCFLAYSPSFPPPSPPLPTTSNLIRGHTPIHSRPHAIHRDEHAR
jgi:hypothetical protein